MAERVSRKVCEVGSPKGCEIVAGGPQTTGDRASDRRHPERVLESPPERMVAPLQGAN
jgi:hypothetical protein